MPAVVAGDEVRLTQDIPELGLRLGQQGVVCSVWFSPAVACEVEFQSTEGGFPTRVLLLEHQIASPDERRSIH
jgi:hypothetical protein